MRYSKDHCWVEKTENGVRIGITDFLRNKICKSFVINLCDEDDEIRAGDIIGDVESCDWFDIIAPVSGNVLRVNDEVLENPQILLEKNVWLVEITDVVYTQPLMSEKEYEESYTYGLLRKGRLPRSAGEMSAKQTKGDGRRQRLSIG